MRLTLLQTARATGLFRELRRGMAWYGQAIGDASARGDPRLLHKANERPIMRATANFWRPSSFPAFSAKPPAATKKRVTVRANDAMGLYKASPWRGM